MSVVLDILLVALFGFFVIRGLIKGFLKSVLSFGRLLLAVILTLIFGAAFSAWLDATLIHPPVYEAVLAKVSGMAESASGSVDALLADVSAAFGGLLDTSALSTADGLDAVVEAVSQSISSVISMAIATVVGYILLFAIFFVMLTVAIFMVDKITKLPVIHGCDKLLGVCMGAVSGWLAVSALSSVLYVILYATGDMSVFESSTVFKFVYGINLFKLG